MRGLRDCALVLIFTAAGLAGAATASARLEFVPTLDSSLAYSSARFQADYALPSATTRTSQTSSSGNAYLFASGNLGFSEIPGLWITPTLEVEYVGADTLLNIEDEAFLFNQSLNLYYLLGFNYRLNRVWGLKAKGFGRSEYAAETKDETLASGLYNYQDAGGWAEASANYRLGWPMRLRAGYKGYGRRYPHYTSLVSEYESLVNTQTALKGEYPKNILVNEFWLRQEMTCGGLPLLCNLEAHLKLVDYPEQYALAVDGTQTDRLRHDNYFDLSLELPFLINSYQQLELDYGYRLHTTNQSVYDQSDTLPNGEPNPVFLAGYYDYYQNYLRLLYNVNFAFSLAGFSPRASVSLAFQNRQYTLRPSRQQTDDSGTGGEYRFDAPHWENLVDLGLTWRQPLFARWFNLFLSFHVLSQKSNTTVEDNASYNFNYNTFTAGTAVSF